MAQLIRRHRHGGKNELEEGRINISLKKSFNELVLLNMKIT